MTGQRYEPQRGDVVFDARAGRRGVVTSVQAGGPMSGPSVSLEPASGATGGHWFSKPEFLRLVDRAGKGLADGRPD